MTLCVSLFDVGVFQEWCHGSEAARVSTIKFFSNGGGREGKGSASGQ